MQREGGCHCGAVRFAADVDLSSALRCNCSVCAMRGTVMVHAPLDGFEILSGAEDLSDYAFGSGAAMHHFCRKCGVYTHHRTRSLPTRFAVNAACLDGISVYEDFTDVRVLDGRRHPADTGEWRDAGRALFVSDDKASDPL